MSLRAIGGDSFEIGIGATPIGGFVEIQDARGAFKYQKGSEVYYRCAGDRVLDASFPELAAAKIGSITYTGTQYSATTNIPSWTLGTPTHSRVFVTSTGAILVAMIVHTGTNNQRLINIYRAANMVSTMSLVFSESIAPNDINNSQSGTTWLAIYDKIGFVETANGVFCFWGGATKEGIFYRSTNDGVTFTKTQMTSGLGNTFIKLVSGYNGVVTPGGTSSSTEIQIIANPSGTRILAVPVRGGNPGANQVYYSDDNGVTWSSVSTGTVPLLTYAIASFSGGYYHIVGIAASSTVITHYYSTDGTTWNSRTIVAPSAQGANTNFVPIHSDGTSFIFFSNLYYFYSDSLNPATTNWDYVEIGTASSYNYIFGALPQFSAGTTRPPSGFKKGSDQYGTNITSIQTYTGAQVSYSLLNSQNKGYTISIDGSGANNPPFSLYEFTSVPTGYRFLPALSFSGGYSAISGAELAGNPRWVRIAYVRAA